MALNTAEKLEAKESVAQELSEASERGLTKQLYFYKAIYADLELPLIKHNAHTILTLELHSVHQVIMSNTDTLELDVGNTGSEEGINLNEMISFRAEMLTFDRSLLVDSVFITTESISPIKYQQGKQKLFAPSFQEGEGGKTIIVAKDFVKESEQFQNQKMILNLIPYRNDNYKVSLEFRKSSLIHSIQAKSGLIPFNLKSSIKLSPLIFPTIGTNHSQTLYAKWFKKEKIIPWDIAIKFATTTGISLKELVTTNVIGNDELNLIFDILEVSYQFATQFQYVPRYNASEASSAGGGAKAGDIKPDVIITSKKKPLISIANKDADSVTEGLMRDYIRSLLADDRSKLTIVKAILMSLSDYVTHNSAMSESDFNKAVTPWYIYPTASMDADEKTLKIDRDTKFILGSKYYDVDTRTTVDHPTPTLSPKDFELSQRNSIDVGEETVGFPELPDESGETTLSITGRESFNESLNHLMFAPIEQESQKIFEKGTNAKYEKIIDSTDFKYFREINAGNVAEVIFEYVQKKYYVHTGDFAITKYGTIAETTKTHTFDENKFIARPSTHRAVTISPLGTKIIYSLTLNGFPDPGTKGSDEVVTGTTLDRWIEKYFGYPKNSVIDALGDITWQGSTGRFIYNVTSYKVKMNQVENFEFGLLRAGLITSELPVNVNQQAWIDHIIKRYGDNQFVKIDIEDKLMDPNKLITDLKILKKFTNEIKLNIYKEDGTKLTTFEINLFSILDEKINGEYILLR